MAIPAESLDLIKSFEGYLRPLGDGSDRVKPYLCPARVWTVGYGSTFYENRRKVASHDTPITRARALELLAFEIERICEPGVDKAVTVGLHALSRGALVSFAFNCGVGALKKSTLIKRVNAKRWADVPKELAKWRMGGGRVLPGLTRRRAAEATMFLRGVAAYNRGETGAATPAPPLPERRGVPVSDGWRGAIRAAWRWLFA